MRDAAFQLNAATAESARISSHLLDRLAKKPSSDQDEQLQRAIEARRSIVRKYRTIGVTAQWMNHLGAQDIADLERAFDLGRALGREIEYWVEGYTAREVLEELQELEEAAKKQGITLP